MEAVTGNEKKKAASCRRVGATRKCWIWKTGMQFLNTFSIFWVLFSVMFCQFQRKLMWSILKEMSKYPWLKRKLMARGRKETTAKLTKKLVLWHVSESEEHKQVLFTLRSCRINGWRYEIAVKMENLHKFISFKIFALNFPFQNIFTKILTCEKFKNCSVAKICWLISHFLMLYNDPSNPFEVMFFIHTEFDYLVFARKVRKTTI